MAHGYISSRGILEVEDVGNQICNELLLRSLFQYVTTTDSIMMHDLVHDLAQSIVKNKVPEVVERQVASTSNYANIREVAFEENLVAFPARTQHDMDLSSILTKFSSLRVLRAIINDLPSTVDNLKHLRFLNLSHSNIRTLPNSLCNIWNLQMLNLKWCNKLVALPRNMRHLKNLRHLNLRFCNSLRGMPSKIGELSYLKTLSLFIVGSERGNQLEELQCLNLSEELEIKHLERVRNYTDAKKAKLSEKKELRELSLKWVSNSSIAESRVDIDEKVLEALEPHPNLQILTIRGFSGRCFPVWMSDSVLKNLVRMNMMNCPHCLHLRELGKLPHLETLWLKKVGVEYIIEDENAVDTLFPSLKTLDLCSLHNLKGLSKEQGSTKGTRLNALPDWLEDLTSLQSLIIYNCPKVVSLPASIQGMRNLQTLVISECPELERRCKRGSGEDWHYISHIPKLQISQ